MTIPKKNSGRDFDFPPGPSLKRPKGGCGPPLETPVRRRTGVFFCVGTGDGGWGRGACDHAGCFGLWETRLGRPGRSRSGLGCSSTVGAGLCPRPVFRGDGGSVGADLCVGPGTVSRGRHHGRTHRSAPTRGGRRLGTNGNWCGTMPFPAGRDGARPLRGGGSGGVRGGVWSPRPTGATLVVPSGGPMWASAPTKRRESCIDHPGQRRTAERLRQRV